MEHKKLMSNFYNAQGSAGKQDMILQEMGDLIVREPQAVALVIQNAGIELPLDSSPAKITKTIMVHKGNQRLIQNLSALIVLKDKMSNFFKKKSGGSTTGTTGGDKTNFFKKIGGLFKRPVNPDGSKGKSKFASWFSKNKGDIGEVTGALAGGLLSGSKQGGGQQGGGQQGGGMMYGNQNMNQGGGNVKPPMKMGVKLAIGGGVLLLIVGIIVVMRRK